jgi:hypothetical protein
MRPVRLLLGAVALSLVALLPAEVMAQPYRHPPRRVAYFAPRVYYAPAPVYYRPAYPVYVPPAYYLSPSAAYAYSRRSTGYYPPVVEYGAYGYWGSYYAPPPTYYYVPPPTYYYPVWPY